MRCTSCKKRLVQDVVGIIVRQYAWFFKTKCPCGQPMNLEARTNPGYFRIHETTPFEFEKGTVKEWSGPYPPGSVINLSMVVALRILITPSYRLSKILALVNQKLPATSVRLPEAYCNAIRVPNPLPNLQGENAKVFLLPKDAVAHKDGYLAYLAIRYLPAGIYRLDTTSFVTYHPLILFHAYNPINELLIAGEMEWGGLPKGYRDKRIAELALKLATNHVANNYPTHFNWPQRIED